MKIQGHYLYDYPIEKLIVTQAKHATTLTDIILKSRDLLAFALK